MLEKVLLTVLPTLTGCIITYIFSKKDGKKKIKSKYKENNFFKFTHWLRVNVFKFYEMLMFLSFWLIFYMFLKHALHFNLPDSAYKSQPYVVLAFFLYSLFVTIDILFNEDAKK